MQSKTIDIVGRRFGRLLVIERADSKSKRATWRCKCDCGNETAVIGKDLRNGHSTSCGCARADAASAANRCDLTGQVFERLTVVGPANPANGRVGKWACLCTCGNRCEVSSGNLTGKKTRSCGCLKKFKKTDGASAWKQKWWHYRMSARTKGYEFELTIEQFKSLAQQPCHYCDAPPARRTKYKSTTTNVWFNGLDRTDNDVGYTLDNVVPCCWRCNELKGARLTYNEMLLIAPTLKAIWRARDVASTSTTSLTEHNL